MADNAPLNIYSRNPFGRNGRDCIFYFDIDRPSSYEVI